jgi:hypothetical protein
MNYYYLLSLCICFSNLKFYLSAKEDIYEYNDYFNSTDFEELIKKNRTDEAMKEFQDWEDKIQKFYPEFLLTVKIPKKDYTIFYEEITHVPTTVTVAFYVHQEDEKIDFEVYKSEKRPLKKIKGKNREFYEFNVTSPAIYEFHLNNERVLKI